MRKKIQSSMILVIALTLIIAYAITTLVVYRQTIHIMEGEVTGGGLYQCSNRYLRRILSEDNG